jgi:hypothetical protein
LWWHSNTAPVFSLTNNHLQDEKPSILSLRGLLAAIRPPSKGSSDARLKKKDAFFAKYKQKQHPE